MKEKKTTIDKNKSVRFFFDRKWFVLAFVIVLVFAIVGFRLNSIVSNDRELLNQIQTENEILKQKIGEIEIVNKDLRNRVDFAINDNSKLKEDLNDLSYETQNFAEDKCSALEDDKDVVERDIEDLEKEILDLEDEIEQGQADDEDVSDLENDLDEKRGDLQTLEDDLDEVNGDLEAENC